MATDRPTFSESWYRVAELKPRLRSLVQSFRQHYRAATWTVLRDPSNNKFYRLDDANYHFVGLLDGTRTVDEVWRACQEDLGDRAPTQGEAIQLLGQLYTSNLIDAEVSADAAGMFERYRKRKRREVGGYFMNILFARIPIMDPEPILERWVKVFGLAFSPLGIVAWCVLVGFALFQLLGHTDELFGTSLFDQQQGVLAPRNLPYLYAMLVLTKVVHEFGHGFACKYFGKKSHSGGEVHTLGIMLMAFVPVPYVDASSAWALRSKWQRAFIGAAGMYAELAIAAVAAIIWVNTGDNDGFSQLLHRLSYNAIFIAGVSTLLFNANPLIRFDGYYILSDLLEMPNLAQRSKEYLYYLVKKYVYKVRRPRDPSHTRGERPLLLTYCVSSFFYRIFITVAILLFVMSFEVFRAIGLLAAAMAMFSYFVLPMGKWVHYLLVNPELVRTRRRELLTTAVFWVALIIGFGVIKVPDRDRAEGVVEPEDVRVIYARTPGFVVDILPSGTTVGPDGVPLYRAENFPLELELERARAELKEIHAAYIQAVARGSGEATAVLEQISARREHIRQLEEDLDDLTAEAPFAGRWVAGQTDSVLGEFVEPGQALGTVVTDDDVFIRIAANQTFGPLLQDNLDAQVEVRVAGRPEQAFEGRIAEVSDAGQRNLPSRALGYSAGGSIETDVSDQEGMRAAQSFYEVKIELEDPTDAAGLMSGQRVVARFELPKASILTQAWRALVRAYNERTTP